MPPSAEISPISTPASTNAAQSTGAMVLDSDAVESQLAGAGEIPARAVTHANLISTQVATQVTTQMKAYCAPHFSSMARVRPFVSRVIAIPDVCLHVKCQNRFFASEDAPATMVVLANGEDPTAAPHNLPPISFKSDITAGNGISLAHLRAYAVGYELVDNAAAAATLTRNTLSKLRLPHIDISY
ncbi:hypothetical protein MNV49_006947 [Pseudohyphozyma bogoriensis]|nr:hypothetical protein MNV49_006947 [Pseudohyphozyma bogoriensis]